ncbi:histidinol-phosphate aminotransferase [Neobacillus bataviensis LMG 21833]|uniref:Histidinol-phosphate aminotransferase n=1 Tax=Neobacillus bataviensis LMG 21833 TaxID=1117379 RepID=K6EB14_9BACI|nr:histidinol-phosphate aminotransferase [Neobacillus bataviensis LMG 21833]
MFKFKVIPIPLDHGYQFNIDAILSTVTDHTKLIYICSLNNPMETTKSIDGN